MIYTRAIITGAMVWVFIFLTFAVLGFVPDIKNSLNIQSLIVGILIVPYTLFGTSIYYKNGNKTNGAFIGIIMAITALILDALITVPLIEIPNGRSYWSFYTYTPLWLLVFINMTTVYFYWRCKVKLD